MILVSCAGEEPDLSNDSDDDDDDDVYEEDQEELEKDLDNDDVVRQQAGELSGNQFLAKYYAISDVSGHQRHRVGRLLRPILKMFMLSFYAFLYAIDLQYFLESYLVALNNSEQWSIQWNTFCNPTILDSSLLS